MDSSKNLINYFECEICEKTFPTRQNKTRHIGNVHGEAKKELCELCKKGYSST